MHLRDYSTSIRVAGCVAFVGCSGTFAYTSICFCLAYITISQKIPTTNEAVGLVTGVLLSLIPVFTSVIQIWSVFMVGIVIVLDKEEPPSLPIEESPRIEEKHSFFDCF